jgi:CDP-glycerol glycerophosphotransferase
VRIVYQSFEGRYCDNPRALYEGLVAAGAEHEHVWVVDPAHGHGFPDGLATVTWGSPECAQALHDADLVVANTHTDMPWERRPEARYLQTWHGTPLKRIHWDVLWAPEGRLERLQGDVDRWDLLVSPNPDSTRLLRRAFRYEKTVLETGYPRNDVLLRPDREQVRARMRAELGIPDGAVAVLYTPTWRDDAVFPEGGKQPELGLDVQALVDALGGTHVLLARLHYTLTGRMAQLEHPAVRDVSAHPEVAELYLAADVLLTDYSSAMFDFAVTGGPILLLTHDLADYRDRLRGFYLDLEEIAPGPLLESTEQVVHALQDLDAVREAFSPRYAAFRDRFCGLEDGHATQRVLEAVGGLLP